MAEQEKVVLVDSYDNEIGVEEKLKAHTNGGTLHRAISIFIFDKKGETMLQQRADTKYHCAGLWSNTTCGHPLPGENPGTTAHRKLMQEMGFDCDMFEAFSFTYEAKLSNGLTEKEFDHVFFGTYTGEPKLNPDEAKSWKWMKIYELKRDLKKRPELYTPWLKIVIGEVIAHYRGQSNSPRLSGE